MIGGAFSSGQDNPFSRGAGEGADAGKDYQGGWIVSEKKPEYDEIFMKLNPINGKVKGSEAKKVRCCDRKAAGFKWSSIVKVANSSPPEFAYLTLQCAC